MSFVPKSRPSQQILFQEKENLRKKLCWRFQGVQGTVHQLPEEEKVVGLVDSMALYNISLGTGNYKAGYKVQKNFF